MPEPLRNLFPDISKPETFIKYPPTFPTLPPLPTFSTEKPKNLLEFLSEELKPQNNSALLPFQPVKFGNPFTPNPLISLFTTKKPLFEIPQFPEIKGIPVHKMEQLPIFHQPTFKLSDPFYNPLLPKRRNKLYDILTGVSTLPPLINLFSPNNFS